MAFRDFAGATLLLICSGGVTSAQNVMVGGTYTCSGVKRIVESCDESYCIVQTLNPYALNGKGARLEIMRSGMDQALAQCSVSGGTALATTPSGSRTLQAATPVNPAYVAGAGADVQMGEQKPGSGAAKRLVPNRYSCSIFIGVPPNGHMQASPGFTLSANGRYQDQNGGRGTYSVAAGILTFRGGRFDGQAATYDSGATGGGTVHIYNQSRSRTLIDCEGG